MKNLFPLLLIAVSLAACKETPSETAEDVAEARAEGTEEVREAQADRNEAVQDAVTPDDDMESQEEELEDVSDEQYDVDVAAAKATLDVEQEKCEAMTGDARDTCKDAAKAIYDQAVAEADLRRAERAAAIQN